MGLILYVLSVILQVIFVPIGVLYGLVKAFYDTHFIDGLKYANTKFRRMAIGTDVYGNVYGSELLNDALLTKEGAQRFGDYGMTISQVLGYNIRSGTLTTTGKLIVRILTEEHCLNAIKNPLKK